MHHLLEWYFKSVGTPVDVFEKCLPFYWFYFYPVLPRQSTALRQVLPFYLFYLVLLLRSSLVSALFVFLLLLAGLFLRFSHAVELVEP